MNTSIFFDFRYISGDKQLSESMRDGLLAAAEGNEMFFLRLASVTLDFKVALFGMFGGLRVEDDEEFLAKPLILKQRFKRLRTLPDCTHYHMVCA